MYTIKKNRIIINECEIIGILSLPCESQRALQQRIDKMTYLRSSYILTLRQIK